MTCCDLGSLGPPVLLFVSDLVGLVPENLPQVADRDQAGQPKPAACLAPPNLLLPFWPHRLPRLPVAGWDNPLPALLLPPYPERIRGDVICFT